MMDFLLKRGLLASFIISLCVGSSFSTLAMEEVDLKGSPSTACSTVRLPTPRTQQEINDIVTSTAKRVYRQINKNWTYAAPGQKMKTGSEFWVPAQTEDCIRTSAGGTQLVSVHTLLLKTDPYKLIEALEDLIQKPAALECTIALTTVEIFCLRELLGPRFNAYAVELYTITQTHSTWRPDQFFHELPRQFLTFVKEKAIPGSITYIANIPAYTLFKPKGNARGDNVFCTGEGQYLGFDEMYAMGPRCLTDIVDRDLESFIRTDDLEQLLNIESSRATKYYEAHSQLCQKYRQTPGLFACEHRKAQSKIISYQFFDLHKINEYFETGTIYI